MAFIEFRDVRKIYQMGEVEVAAVDGMSFTVEKGEFVVVVGPSGSGKTTLLNMLGGMDSCTSGTIMLDGREVSSFNEKELTYYRRYDIGFVFQSYNLIQGMTAVENVAMPLMFRRVSRKKREEAAREMLKQVGLGERMDHRPNEMSGGQQQRVGIARAFVRTTAMPRRSKTLLPPLPRSCRRPCNLPITHWPPAKEEYDREKDEQDPDIHSGAGHGAEHRGDGRYYECLSVYYFSH